LPLNSHKINIEKVNWINPDFTEDNKIKIKNFMGGQKIKWKVVSN
jgi:Dihydroorotase